MFCYVTAVILDFRLVVKHELCRGQFNEHIYRICTLCSKNEIDDEFHYLFSCDNCINQRTLYIKEMFRNRPNTLKFKKNITSKNKYDLQKLCRFAAILNKGVCPPS